MGTYPEDEMHQAATLTGGKVPAHAPGAYPRLSCCGGPVLLVPEDGATNIPTPQLIVKAGDITTWRNTGHDDNEGDLPNGTATVTIIRPLIEGVEVDPEVGPMFKVTDGTLTFDAFEDELS